jgi:hypothetical protein
MSLDYRGGRPAGQQKTREHFTIGARHRRC